MTELTPVQSEVLQAIRERTSSQGYPPTVRELGSLLGLSSPSTVHSHLNALQRKGYITRDPTKPRAIAVTGRARGEHAADAVNDARFWAGVLSKEGREQAAADLRAVADELDRLRGLIPDPGEGR